MPGQQARGFLRIQPVGGDKGFQELVQLLLQALGEELLVEAGGWGWSGIANQTPEQRLLPWIAGLE